MGTEGSTAVQPLLPASYGLAPLADPAVSGSATCGLPPRYEAVRNARDFTEETLRRWDLAAEYDTVALVVSELVTNALRHGLPGAGAVLRPDLGGAPVHLDLMRWAARLVCAVRDPSTAAPEPAAEPDEHGVPGGPSLDAFALPGDDTAESGRGLRLVESFSDGWGWHPLTGTQRGKVVWARFELAV